MPTDVYLARVLEDCKVMSRTRFWPSPQNIRVEEWLNNFPAAERPIAAAILDNFTFFSEMQTNAMLKRAFGRLLESAASTSWAARSTSIAQFVQTAVFTPVEGEDPNRSDSGNLLCRKCRQHLGVEENKILDPADALQAARTGAPIVFVDDFVGSGNQFVNTWNRQYSTTPPRSFAQLFATTPFAAHFLCLLITPTGTRRLANTGVTVHNAYQTRSSNHIGFPNIIGGRNITPAIIALLQKYAPGLDVPAYLNDSRSRMFGFHRLGLTLAFEHCVPDAALPILWSRAGTQWIPLRERT